MGYIYLKICTYPHFRYKAEDVGNQNDGVVSDENDNKEDKTTTTVVRRSTTQRRKKLRVSLKNDTEPLKNK